VINSGDRREAIFRDDKDRENFLTALAQVCGRTGWEVATSITCCINGARQAKGNCKYDNIMN